MSITQQLQQSSALTPAEHERRKSSQQRAEDFMYTMNHAITCLSVTDFLIAPLVSSLFGWQLCGHDHSHGDHDHDHHHHDHAHEHHEAHHDHAPQTRWQKTKNWFGERLKLNPAALKEWFIGEFAGDVGAVPVTLAAQRYAPGLMQGIEQLLEPLVGGVMHRRAEKAAQHWAVKHNVQDNQQIVARAEELYHYEMRHLPQMAIWTLSSIGINYGVMRYRNPELALGTFAKGKAAGAAITAALVLGARTLSPAKAHAWDETMSRHVVVPLSKKIGRAVGMNTDEMEKRSQQRWADRIAQEEKTETVLSA